MSERWSVLVAPGQARLPPALLSWMKDKKKASGVNIPEAQRGTVQVKLRLPPDLAWELEVLSLKWKLTKSGVVAKLIEQEVEDE